MLWFTPPISVQNPAKPGLIRNVTSVEAAAEELLKWPQKGRKRARAAMVLHDALAGKTTPEAARKAFEAAAKEAGAWVQYRGPL